MFQRFDNLTMQEEQEILDIEKNAKKNGKRKSYNIAEKLLGEKQVEEEQERE